MWSCLFSLDLLETVINSREYGVCSLDIGFVLIFEKVCLICRKCSDFHLLFRREGQPSILGPDRLSTAAQAVLSIEHIREDIEADVQQLMQLADLKDITGMEAAATKISDKVCHCILHVLNWLLLHKGTGGMHWLSVDVFCTFSSGSSSFLLLH